MDLVCLKMIMYVRKVSKSVPLKPKKTCLKNSPNGKTNKPE